MEQYKNYQNNQQNPSYNDENIRNLQNTNLGSTNTINPNSNPNLPKSSYRNRNLSDGRDYFNENKVSIKNQQGCEVNLWDPFLSILPPIGSRMAFNGVNKPKGKRMLRYLPKLDNCLDQQNLYPLCLHGYREYLSNIENCEQDLDFWLDYSVLTKAEKSPSIPMSNTNAGNTSKNNPPNSNFVTKA
ncbi:hypothetical protein AYI69_g9658, partial [Smittium culicis]